MLAFERLSQIIPWFADPPDEWHIEAATALVKICAGSRDLGEAVARVPWVNDGIRVDEIRLIRYLRDRAHNDPTAEVVQGRYWFHVSGGEREVHLEMLVLVAHGARRNPDLVPVLYDLPQIAGSVLDDYWMGRDWIQVADRSVEAALTATAFVSANESAGQALLSALSLLATGSRTSERFDELVAAPWFVDGLDGAEADFVVALSDASGNPAQFDHLFNSGVTSTSS